MIFNAKLLLENGSEFKGNLIGADIESAQVGEVVFNTSMAGYQEILTDPSYCDQIICLTYPLIGNYGISMEFNESFLPACKGLIIRDCCDFPSHFKTEMSLEEFLKNNELVALKDVDTRALTKVLRENGTLKGKIVSISAIDDDTSKLMKKNKNLELIRNTQLSAQVSKVSTKEIKVHKQSVEGKKIVLIDYGYKKNILKSLLNRGLNVAVVPHNVTLEQINEIQPDAICLSNGPGDPEDLRQEINVIKDLQKEYPIFGICLGHQLICLANGAKTKKMLYGHRGANHPVKDLETGQVYMSSQNHGYVVDDNSLMNTNLKEWFVNVNDKSIEGVKLINRPVMSVQFHPEAQPGPRDTHFLFDQFLEMIS